MKPTWALAALILILGLWGGYGIPGQWGVAVAGLALSLLVLRRPELVWALRPADWLPALLPLGYALALGRPASLPSAVAALFGALGLLGVYLWSAGMGHRREAGEFTADWARSLLGAGALLAAADAAGSLMPAWAGSLWADHRLSGLWGYANATAAFHALAAFCGVAAGVRRDGPGWRALATGLIGINLLAVLATGSRMVVALTIIGLVTVPFVATGITRRATVVACGALAGALAGAAPMWGLATRGWGDGAALTAALAATAVVAPGVGLLLARLLGRVCANVKVHH